MNAVILKFSNHIATSVIFLFGLTWPWILLKITGLSQIGFNEESVGYRYFHTLRILYASDEFPWLPQGHLPGLLYMLIQLTLTAFGFPITDHDMRLELFVDSVVVIQAFLVAITFYFAFLKVESFLARVASASLLLIASYAHSSFNWGMHLFTPDYMVWVLVAACILVYAFITLSSHIRELTYVDYTLLGIFAGFCLAIKVTYLIFPFTIWLMMTNYSNWKTLIPGSLISAIMATFIFCSVLALYYKFNLNALYLHFENTYNFLKSAEDTSAAWQWFASLTTTSPLNIVTVSMLLPLFFICGIFFANSRKICIPLFVGTALESIICWTRFNGVTNIETNTFAASALIIYFLLVIKPWIGNNIVISGKRSLGLINYIPNISATLLLVYMTCSEIKILTDRVFGPIAMTAQSDWKLATYLQMEGGKTLFITPDNSLRPLSVDSAIYKGATDVTNSHWDQSKFMKKIFPNRWYIYGLEVPGVGDVPAVQNFQTIVFTYFPNNRDMVFESMNTTYGINMEEFSCQFEAPTGNGANIVCCTRKAK